jgi:NAD(P)-dependent dehydrogenase (short-subunit alcohol dehydrogenase family)
MLLQASRLPLPQTRRLGELAHGDTDGRCSGRTENKFSVINPMARIFITGSSEGLGLMAAQLLASEGHGVTLHARNTQRAKDASASLSAAEALVVGDLSSVAGMREVAEQVNALGRFDAVIHNAGIGYREPRRVATVDGLSQLFAVNVLAPYVLTALIERPQRLVYLSSGMHQGAQADLDDLNWLTRSWQGSAAYAESKLLDVMLAFAVARLWKDVFSNALEPGWVATRMGGRGAPDDMDQAHRTQAWLATSDNREACVTGRYFFHLKQRASNPSAQDIRLQDRLLAACAKFSAIVLPA